MKKVLIATFVLCMLLCLVGCGLSSKNVEIIAYLDDDLSQAQALTISAELNTMPDVTGTEFISGEEAWEDFLSHQEDPLDFSGVDTSIIQSRYIISAKTRNVKALVSAIEDIDGIEDVSYFIIK